MDMLPTQGPRGSMNLIRIILISILLLILTGCATNPVTGEREIGMVSEQAELDIGRRQYQPTRQMQGGDYTLDPKLTRYVESVGNKLAAVSDRKLPYEFSVVNDSSPNAWALPGGKIAINRGLLVELDNEAELAAVLGHEIVHAAARHSAQGMERQTLMQGALIAAGALIGSSGYADYSDLALGAAAVGANMVNQRYSREAELESDYYGMRYMHKAGYDPHAAIALQETFVRLSKGGQQSWLSGLFASHPPSPERVAANRKTAATLGKGGRLGKKKYRQMTAGLRRSRPAYKAYDEGLALLEKQPKQALKLANKAISIEPKEGLFYALRGDALVRTENPRAALKAYDRAVARNRNFFRPYLKRGAVKADLNDIPGARSDLQRSLKLLPTAEGHYMLGLIERSDGDTQAAMRHFRTAASSNSPAGRAAGKELQRLSSGSRAVNQLPTALGMDRGGNLLVQVTNNTGATIKDIVVLVGRSDAAGRIYRGKEHNLDAVLRPGQRIRFRTEIRGLSNPEQLKSYAAKVRSARQVR